MVFSNEQLIGYYGDIVNKYEKIRSEVKKNRISKVRRGVYSNNAHADRLSIANNIIRDSYISFDYALYFYGLIPERVSVITSATRNKRRKNVVITEFDKYIYRDTCSTAFSEGLTCIIDEGNNLVRIASKEKALCDRLSLVPQIRTIKEMYQLLFDDLRIDIDEFLNLNFNEIIRLASLYSKPTLNTLIKYIKRLGKYASNYWWTIKSV